jgi:hypothetical protein
MPKGLLASRDSNPRFLAWQLPPQNAEIGWCSVCLDLRLCECDLVNGGSLPLFPFSKKKNFNFLPEQDEKYSRIINVHDV